MKHKIKGFSLIELLATVVIIGVMAVSVMNLYSFGSGMNFLVEEDLSVANLLQYKIEEIRCQPFAKDITVTDQVITGFGKYKLSTTQTVPYLGNPYLKKVHVSCFYPSGVGVNKTEQIDFLIANKL